MTFPLARRYKTIVQPMNASADLLTPVDVAMEAEAVSSVLYVPTAAQAGAATNNRTLTLFNRGSGAGTGTVNVASLTLVSGTDLSDNVAKAITLSTTSGNLVLASGDVLEWSSVHNSAGVADPGGIVLVKTARVVS